MGPSGANWSDLTSLSVAELLRLYASTLDQLLERGVVRTRNAPAGDLAERLAAIVYGGALAPNSHKSADVLLDDGRTVQVKSRVVGTESKGGNYSFIRSWDFDLAVFVLFDVATYGVIQAIEVSSDEARAASSFSNHVGADRLRLSENLLAMSTARDLTGDFAAALANL